MHFSVSIWAHNQQFQQQANNSPTIHEIKIHHLKIYRAMNLDSKKIPPKEEII